MLDHTNTFIDSQKLCLRQLASGERSNVAKCGEQFSPAVGERRRHWVRLQDISQCDQASPVTPCFYEGAKRCEQLLVVLDHEIEMTVTFVAVVVRMVAPEGLEPPTLSSED